MYINIMKKLLPILLLTILVSLIACSTSNNDENGGLCPGAIASNKQYKNPEKCNLQPDKRYIATIQMDKGDKITIDSDKKTLSLDLSERERTERLKKWVPPPPKVKRGLLAKYARLVSSASLGAVTDIEM